MFAPKETTPQGDPSLYSFVPDELPVSTGLIPYRAGTRGDQRRNGRYRTRNFGELRSSLPQDAAPHEHVRNVLEQIRLAWPKFVAAALTHSATMHLAIKGQNQGMWLPRTEMLRLAELKAELDIDAYDTDEAAAPLFGPLRPAGVSCWT